MIDEIKGRTGRLYDKAIKATLGVLLSALFYVFVGELLPRNSLRLFFE